MSIVRYLLNAELMPRIAVGLFTSTGFGEEHFGVQGGYGGHEAVFLRPVLNLPPVFLLEFLVVPGQYHGRILQRRTPHHVLVLSLMVQSSHFYGEI